MVTIIKQTWWHIEEMYHPSNARKIRHVMDIFTDETQIPIKLDDEWVGLRVNARNSLPNREVAFLEDKDTKENINSSLILNLEPLSSFPSVPKSFANKFDWNSIPGDDNNRLLNFLKNEIDFNRVEKAKIIKKNGGRTILISNEEKSVEIRLNENNENTTLTTNDGRTYNLQVREENGRCNMYYFNADLKHVKLEIEYISTNTKVERLADRGLKDKIIDKITARRKATAQVSGLIQPEIYMTIPTGWIISGRKEGYSFGMKCIIQNTRNDGIIDLSKPQKTLELRFGKPFIKMDNNERRIYNYLINEDDYSKLKKDIENSDSRVSFEFTYFSQMSNIVTLIAMIPFIFFLPISADIFYYGVSSFIRKSPFNFESSFAIGYSIIMLSFSYFYYSLIKGNLHIPYKNLYTPIFVFTILMIMLILFKELLF